MSEAAEKPVGRPMKFPYTFSAKLAQFPYKFYFKNQWIYRYYVPAVILCLPVFNYFRKLCKSFQILKVVFKKTKALAINSHFQYEKIIIIICLFYSKFP